MKIIEINNRKDTYVYDEEYCEFFNDDGDWEHLDPNDISQEFEIPKERETLVLKQELKVARATHKELFGGEEEEEEEEAED